LPLRTGVSGSCRRTLCDPSVRLLVLCLTRRLRMQPILRPRHFGSVMTGRMALNVMFYTTSEWAWQFMLRAAVGNYYCHWLYEFKT